MARDTKSRFPLTYQDMWAELRKQLHADQSDTKDRAMTACHTLDELAFQQGRYRQLVDIDAQMETLEKNHARRIDPNDNLSEDDADAA